MTEESIGKDNHVEAEDTITTGLPEEEAFLATVTYVREIYIPLPSELEGKELEEFQKERTRQYKHKPGKNSTTFGIALIMVRNHTLTTVPELARDGHLTFPFVQKLNYLSNRLPNIKALSADAQEEVPRITAEAFSNGMRMLQDFTTAEIREADRKLLQRHIADFLRAAIRNDLDTVSADSQRVLVADRLIAITGRTPEQLLYSLDDPGIVLEVQSLFTNGPKPERQEQ